MLLSILVVAQLAAATPSPSPLGSTAVPTPLAGSKDLSSVAGQKKIDRAKADAMFKQDGSTLSTPSPVHSDLAVPEPVKKTVAETAREQSRWHEKAVKLQDALSRKPRPISSGRSSGTRWRPTG
jgi:hypothetical protein